MGEAYVSPQVYVDMERALKIDAQKRLDRVVAAAAAKGVRALGWGREVEGGRDDRDGHPRPHGDQRAAAGQRHVARADVVAVSGAGHPGAVSPA